ncbi:hypothetical protein D3C73_1538460 [compost metagenome]
MLQDSIDISDDHFMNQVRQIMMDRSSKEKQLALDILKMMFTHLDEIKTDTDN